MEEEEAEDEAEEEAEECCANLNSVRARSDERPLVILGDLDSSWIASPSHKWVVYILLAPR